MPESSRRPPASLVGALSLAREALGAPPAGLLTDFDGTLSPIVTDPWAARPADGAAEALGALAARLAVVAVITGRGAVDARERIGVPGLLIAGNHGTEWLEPHASAPVASADAVRIGRSLDVIIDSLPAMAGVAIEHKGLSATIHWRAAPDPEVARAAIIAAIGDPGPGVELHPGRMSIELRPAGLGDKGSAAARIVERFGLRGVVVLGDDVTDLDMFRAISSVRSAGSLRAAVIAVGRADGEVPPEVANAADALIESPEDAVSLLRELSRRDPPDR